MECLRSAAARRGTRGGEAPSGRWEDAAAAVATGASCSSTPSPLPVLLGAELRRCSGTRLVATGPVVATFVAAMGADVPAAASPAVSATSAAIAAPSARAALPPTDSTDATDILERRTGSVAADALLTWLSVLKRRCCESSVPWTRLSASASLVSTGATAVPESSTSVRPPTTTSGVGGSPSALASGCGGGSAACSVDGGCGDSKGATGERAEPSPACSVATDAAAAPAMASPGPGTAVGACDASRSASASPAASTPPSAAASSVFAAPSTPSASAPAAASPSSAGNSSCSMPGVRVPSTLAPPSTPPSAPWFRGDGSPSTSPARGVSVGLGVDVDVETARDDLPARASSAAAAAAASEAPSSTASTDPPAGAPTRCPKNQVMPAPRLDEPRSPEVEPATSFALADGASSLVVRRRRLPDDTPTPSAVAMEGRSETGARNSSSTGSVRVTGSAAITRT
mmetsp:Transcript_3708/g.11647  ORF Transcript_3708/g.11647 Transcript_3708/m.11647 type:complete len:458 (+) Transcript_3708:1293-2666(+)